MFSRACLLRYSLLCMADLSIVPVAISRHFPQCFLTRLLQQFCLLLVCPHLSGWVSSSDAEPVPLALSPESIYNSGQKIFVLDSFVNVSVMLQPPACCFDSKQQITVFYGTSAAAEVMPPHAGSKLALAIKHLKTSRPLVKRLCKYAYNTRSLTCDYRSQELYIFVRVTRARKSSFPA